MGKKEEIDISRLGLTLKGMRVVQLMKEDGLNFEEALKKVDEEGWNHPGLFKAS